MTTQELQTVLAISRTIATIREKSELLKLLIEQLQPLFNCYDCGLFVFNKDKTTLEDLTVSLPSISPSAANQLLADDHAAFTTYQGSVFEWVFDRLRSANAPFVHQYKEDQVPDWVNYVKAPVIDSIGYEESMVAVLRTGGDEIGVFMVNSLQKGTFHRNQYILYQAIADQVAVAVANILANEEILEREWEKSQLLEITNLVAQVKVKEDLLKLIVDKIKPLFRFHDCGLFVLSVDGNTHSDLAALPGVDPSELNQMHASVSFGVPHQGSLIEWMIQEIEVVGGPMLFDFKDLVERYPDYPQFVAGTFLESGYRDCLAVNLVVRGKTIGLFCINALEKDFFQQDLFGLFLSVANTVAVAVANILANEEILEREREKTQLLAISQAIATVQESKQLLRVIYETIRPVLPFSDAGLFVINAQGNHRDLIVDEQVFETPASLSLQEQQLDGWLPDHPVLEYFLVQGPVQEALANMYARFPGHPHYPALQAAGYEHILGGALRQGGQTIGMLCFFPQPGTTYTATDINIFRSISDQVAVAVANILANQEILEREREKSQLLEITELIAQVKANDDLLRLIVDKIKPLFRFHDCGLFVVSPDGKTHTDLAAVLPDVSPSDWNQAIAAVSVNVTHQGSPAEWVMSELEAAEKPVLFDFREMVEKFPAYPQFENTGILEMGYRDCVAASLTVRGKSIGFFCINALAKNFFQPTIFPLFKSVTHNLSIAVANILANEEIRKREQEKAILLAITSSFSLVRTRVELMALINQQVRPLFGFNEMTNILLLSADGEWLDYFTTLPQELLTTAPVVTSLVPRIPFRGLFKDAFHTRKAFIRDKSFFLEQAANEDVNGQLGRLVVQMGIEQAMVCLLQSRSKIIGSLHVHSTDPNQFTESMLTMFTAVADQVAVAVDNILANEEILQREQEKANLLAISTAIATIRDKDDLFRVITETVRPILGFDEAAQIFAIDPTDQTIGIFLRNTSQMISQDADYQQLTRKRFAIAGSPFEKILAWPTVYVLDPAQEAKHYPQYPGFPIMVRMGIRQSMITPLRYGGRIIGTFHVFSTRAGFFGPQHFAFYETVANQIAVAVANILANEELLQRESEKALQLAVSNALADGHDWDQKLLTLAKTIQPAVPFDYAIVGLETGGQIRHGYGFYRTGPDEYQILLADDFLRLSRLTAEQYTQMRQQLNDAQPLLLNGAEFEQHCRQFALKQRISQTFRLQSHILFPIPLTREGRFTLAFYSRQGDTYRSYHLDLLQKLRPTLALALDRLLAYEEVAALSQQLQQENTYLQEEVRTNYRFEEIVGTSQAVRDVFQKVSKVGPMSSTVLILGETGTGKELVARAIHQASPRQVKPLIKINCAALPAQLIESELFGHEKGAFTGAIERRIGKFELAHESTIFLDEIGELPLELQAKLLRAIQEKEIERLGSNKVIQTDVRVLAATNRNLEKEVAEGRFRSDLYFRLNVYPIKLPPLRERKEDITLLAIHFCQKLSKKLGKAINGFSNGAIKEMQAYHWPGNIRELEHVIERAAIESEGGTIRNLGLLKRPEGELTVMINPTFQLKSYADGERELIMNTVRYCNGRIRGTGGAAQLLQVKATTLEARMKKLGIKREFFVNEGAGTSATN